MATSKKFKEINSKLKVIQLSGSLYDSRIFQRNGMVKEIICSWRFKSTALDPTAIAKDFETIKTWIESRKFQNIKISHYQIIAERNKTKSETDLAELKVQERTIKAKIKKLTKECHR